MSCPSLFMGYNFSVKDINRVICEIGDLLVGGRIQGVFQPRRDDVYFEIFTKNDIRLLLVSVENSFNRIYLISKREESPRNPFSFQMLLRKYLINSYIIKIEQLNEDRVVKICTDDFNIYAELTGRHANIFLTDRDDIIMGSLRENLSQKRPLFVSKKYIHPFPVNLRDNAIIDIPAGMNVSKYYEEFYGRVINDFRLESIRGDIIRSLNRRKSHLESVLGKISKDRDRAIKYSEYLKYAEVLKQNLIIKKENGIALCEYYSESGKDTLTVPIDERLSIPENVQRYFGLYKKYKNSLNLIMRREEELSSELDKLVKEIEEVSRSADIEHLKNIWNSIKSTNISRIASKTEKDKREFPFGVFFLEGVGKIYTGSSAEENEILTFKYARGNDLWFHIIGYSGSHVVLPVVRDKIPSERQIMTAALLAAARSSAPDGETVEVAYTRVKYVRKAKGGEKGAVILSKEKRLFVKVDKKFPHTLIRLS